MNPIWQALGGTLFTWGVTALGAAVVFFFKGINRRLLDGMLGFAAGVMVAASYWSLLAPAIAMAEEEGNIAAWIPAAVGFLLGGLFLWGVDRVLPHLHLGFPMNEAEGIKTRWQRSVLLVLAITLHNFPEGLAVGVAFGALAAGIPSATLAGAMALALGIGLQNFPEGAAVSIPLRREGFSRFKAFMYGQFSGMVEPIAGVTGGGGSTFSTAFAALCPGICSGRYDLCGGRRADPRITARKEHPYCHIRRHDRIRSDDDAGCSVRINEEF